MQGNYFPMQNSLLPLYEALFADFVVSKDSDIWWMDEGFLWVYFFESSTVYKELSSKKND